MTEARSTLAQVAQVLRSAGLLRDALGPGDVSLSGVSQDSRTAVPGDLFLAWQGQEVDAHDFVEEAMARGAVAAVVERPVEVDVPQLVVSDGRRAGALAAHAVMGAPSGSLFTVGVTGTNGKTTTALLARHLLSGRWNAAAVGTLGVVDRDGIRPGTEGLTTPGPVQVAVWLWDLANGGVEAVVMEASSHALEQRRLDGVSFNVGVFTNLTQDHLDYHLDVASYFGAKARLVHLVAPDGSLVVNRDEARWSELDAAGRSVLTFALDTDADLRAENVVLTAGGSRFTLVVSGESAEVTLPLPGRFNVENALAAAAVATAAGLSLDEIVKGLASAPRIPGRLEVISAREATVVVDFAHTPDALANVLDALRPLTPGRLIVVFGAGGDRDRTKRLPMARAVAERADVVVATSDNPRTEDPEAILDDLEPGLSGVPYHRIADREEAIRFALSLAGEGDTVLLAGKGHETYQVVGTEKRPFNERKIVEAYLAGAGAA
ncbi:MAG: UDP-N-acetylmuramoyl-L-alanyl-D-glutamate--2,6-diaminopimelate ligase [Gemmatimonadota bacterium]